MKSDWELNFKNMIKCVFEKDEIKSEEIETREVTEMKFTIKNLEYSLERAKQEGAKYFAIKVKLKEGYNEIIINNKKNFDLKLDYYKKAYNEDLTHKQDNEIEIIGFTYGNTFDEIEVELC